jgi:hypothetical protein
VAKGDWIALLDADGKWYPNHLARAVELLSSHVVGLASTDNSLAQIEHTTILSAHRERVPFRSLDCTIPPRRVRAVGMFDPSQRRRHDSDLWIRMIADQTLDI